MRIVQVLPSLNLGDAIGNDTLALLDALERMGYDTAVYAGSIGNGINHPKVYSFRDCKLTEEDVVLYHLSVGDDMNYQMAKLPAHMVVIYHNVTPQEFFEPYEPSIVEVCRQGAEGVRFLSKYAEYALADSNYNRQELIRLGYTCPIDVLPILIPFSDYEKEPDAQVMNQYRDDGYTNILFTGRIAPNKKQEDVIAAFHAYKEHYNPKSRLILVGTDSGEQYPRALWDYVRRLGVEDVIFTGHISFAAILAYYRLADVFLCMSEHEGFCVPLVEAMKFDVPVVAYDAAAIADTLGGSGLLIETKNPNVVAGVIHRVNTDEELRNVLIANQRERLLDFDHERIFRLFESYLSKYVEGLV